MYVSVHAFKVVFCNCEHVLCCAALIAGEGSALGSDVPSLLSMLPGAASISQHFATDTGGLCSAGFVMPLGHASPTIASAANRRAAVGPADLFGHSGGLHPPHHAVGTMGTIHGSNSQQSLVTSSPTAPLGTMSGRAGDVAVADPSARAAAAVVKLAKAMQEAAETVGDELR